MAGNFYDLAPHLVHHVVSLFGLPNKVYNKLFYDRKGSNVDDHFEMVMYYDHGLRCYLGAEMLDRDPKPRHKLVGTKASYVKYGFDIPDTVYDKSDNLYQNRHIRSDYITDLKHIEHVDVLKGQHYRFYDLLAEHINQIPKTDEDKTLALSVILVMELAMKSSMLGEEIEMPK
jgi:scyllo-inositol 2-dehydrogenase (NADP+)